jgi:two-component system, sensor histidine kinase and response regulator
VAGDPEMRRQLEASLERLDLAASAAGIGFWDWDLVNDRLCADAHSANVYGLSPVGASAAAQLSRLIHPQDLADFNGAIAAALAVGGRSQHRCRVTPPSGFLLHLDIELKVTRDAQGKATRLLAMVSDVTFKVERTARLEQLVATEHALVERLSVATQAAGIFVWEFDWLAMSISFDENRLAHGSANRHYGAELGADFFKYVHEEDRHIGMTSMRAALEKGEHDASFRYRLKLPDAAIRHIQAYARTSADAAGNPVRSVGVSWDITSEVEAAEQLAVKVGNERQLLERLSVAIQAAGLNCWEFSYASDKFTWIDQLPDPHDARELGIEEANRVLSGSAVPEDVAAVRAETERALAAGAQTLSSRMRCVGTDGRTQYHQIYQRFFRDADGRPVRALGATRDVTEEVEAAERLKEQAEQLHEAQRRLERASLSVQEGHWEIDLVNQKHWASSNYYALLGYAPGEIELESLDSVHSIVHPEDDARGMETAQAHLDHGAVYDVEIRVRCKDGEYRWFRLRGSADRDEHGVPVRLSGSIHDIHKQKVAEDALREAKARFERAIHGTQDGLFEVDLVARKIWMSPRMHELLGYTDGELPDDYGVLRDRMHPDDLRVRDAAVQENLEKHVSTDIEVRMRTKSGAYRWYRMRGTPSLDSAGRVQRVSGSTQDVTEAREARDALIRASEAAQAANQAKSAFLANVSHEIRTPMNGIMGMSTLLLDTPLDRMQRDYADTIRASADSLLTVINDILDFSKIEAGKLDIESVEMDLPGNIEDVGATMAFQAAAKGLELIINVHPDVPARVLGDPQRIRQCLINLLGNAIKFTRTGEIAAEVSTQTGEGGRVVTRFEVRDTGIGVAPDTVKSLFQPFVQADSSTTRHFGGTGLGLSIVRRLVEMMGGELGAESQLGKGSTFWFSLPLTQVDSPPVSCEALARHSGRRVLIVDDNETNRRVLATNLAHAGYDVTLASGGREALTTMRVATGRAEPFDAVLADLQMPDIDGAMLGEQINADAQLSSTRVVLLTSLDRQGDVRRFAQLGFAGYLSKPVKARELLACLDKVLAHEAHDWHVQTHPIVTSNALNEHSMAKRYSGRVLLVEDNPVNQKVARRFLERLGCDVTLAENGLECIQAWERGAFQLVLMDVQMPVMDGYTATRQIRDLERGRRRTPIVALTANAMTGQLERCLETGMDGLLTKPLAVEQLQDVLERYGLAVGHGTLSEVAVASLICAPGSPPAIDVTQLQELAAGDEEFIRSIAESFAKSSSALLGSMRNSLASDERRQLARAAHQLKGASANLYAEALRSLCADLEVQAKTLGGTQLEEKISRLAVEIERVCSALNGFAASSASRAVG